MEIPFTEFCTKLWQGESPSNVDQRRAHPGAANVRVGLSLCKANLCLGKEAGGLLEAAIPP